MKGLLVPLLVFAVMAFLCNAVAAEPEWSYYYTRAGNDRNAMVYWEDVSIAANDVSAFVFLAETGGDLVVQCFDQDGNYLRNLTRAVYYQEPSGSNLKRFAYTTYKANNSLTYIITTALVADTYDGKHGVDFKYTVSLFGFDGESLEYLGGQNYTWADLLTFHQYSHDDTVLAAGLFVQGVAVDDDGDMYVAPMGWVQGSYVVIHYTCPGLIHYSLLGVTTTDAISVKTSSFHVGYTTQPPYGYPMYPYMAYGLPLVRHAGSGILGVITPGFYYRYNTYTLMGNMVQESGWEVNPDWIDRPYPQRWITAPYPAGSVLTYLYYSPTTGYILGYEMFSVFADNNQTWVYGSEYIGTQGNVFNRYPVKTMSKFEGASFIVPVSTHTAVFVSSNSSVSPSVWRKIIVKWTGSDTSLTNFAIGTMEASMQSATQRYWTTAFGVYAGNHGYGVGIFDTKTGDYQNAVIQKLTYAVDTAVNMTMMYFAGIGIALTTLSYEYMSGFSGVIFAAHDIVPGTTEAFTGIIRTAIQAIMLFLPPLAVRRYGLFISAVVLLLMGAVLWLSNVIPAYLFGLAAVAALVMMFAARRGEGE